MESKIDRLKAKIDRGEKIIGTQTLWGGAMVTEMYGALGYDVVWIDDEHGVMNKTDISNALVGAATSADMCSFVRIATNDPVLAKPILDMGADGVIFPMICTVEDARKAVRACFYPPRGVRGFGPGRAVKYGMVPGGEYIDRISRKVWPILLIEGIEGVRNLDGILGVEGIGAVFVGAFDLSGSMGLLSQVNHPEVRKALDEAAGKIKAAGIPMGVAMGYNPEFVAYWIEKGADIIFCDNESGYIFGGAKNTLANLRQAVGAR